MQAILHARACLANQRIDGSGRTAFYVGSRSEGIAGAFIVDFRCTWYGFSRIKNLRRLQRLRVLELVVCNSVFEAIEPRFAWEDELTADGAPGSF